MKVLSRIRTEIKIGVALIGIFLLIAFSERKQSDAISKNIIVQLENTNENHFIDEADVMQIIESTGIPVIGKSIDRVNLRSLENKLESNKHILSAEIFGDVKGNLTVNVKLRRPVARLIRDNGPGAYVAEDGKIMSTSAKFSARIILVSGAIVNGLIDKGDLLETEEGRQLMSMVNFVNQDPFWKAQVAQLDFAPSGKVFIYPQVTGQIVEFGKPEDIETKFRNLMIFYKEILPQRGWTKYDRVNVEYEGQVIAE